MLTRRNPCDVPARSTSDDVDRLFEMFAPLRMRTSQVAGALAGHVPPIDLWENDGTIVLEMELPGVALDDVELSVVDHVLTVKGARSFATPDDARYLRRERTRETFERTLTLPAEVDADRIEARLCGGVLHVSIPKADAVRPRRIEVKGS